MGMLNDPSVHVTAAPPSVPATDPVADPGATMHIRKADTVKRRIAIGIGVLALLAGTALTVILRRDSQAAAASADGVAEASNEAPAPAADVPAACAGDLSTASANRQWYCNELVPHTRAVKREIADLKSEVADLKAARSYGGAPAWVIGALVLLGLLNAVTLTIALKRRTS